MAASKSFNITAHLAAIASRQCDYRGSTCGLHKQAGQGFLEELSVTRVAHLLTSLRIMLAPILHGRMTLMQNYGRCQVLASWLDLGYNAEHHTGLLLSA